MATSMNSTTHEPSETSALSALVAGAAVIVAVSWLFFLIAGAIGLGFAEQDDFGSLSDGVGTELILVLTVSTVVAFLAGGWVCAQLARVRSRASGVALGTSLWAVATVSLVVAGLWGVGSLYSAAGTIVSTGASAFSSAARTTASATDEMVEPVEDWLEETLSDDLVTTIKVEISQVVAATQNEFGPRASAEQLRAALNSLDEETLIQIMSQLAQDQSISAAQMIADSTSLSLLELESLADGIQSKVDSFSQSDLVDEIQSNLDGFINDLASVAAEWTPPALSEKEIQNIVDSIQAETLYGVARQFIIGDWDEAQARLVADTALTEQQISSVLENIRSEVESMVSEARRVVVNQLQTAANYASGVLWGLSFASILGWVSVLIGSTIGRRRNAG